MATPSKKRKPRGELAWVVDGKTEYMAQLIDPVAQYKAENKGEDEEKIEVEVQWTHNGIHEWVTLDRIRTDLGTTTRRRKATPKIADTPSKHPRTPKDSNKHPSGKARRTPVQKSKPSPPKRVSPNSDSSVPSPKRNSESPTDKPYTTKEPKKTGTERASKKRNRDEISSDTEEYPTASSEHEVEHSEEPPAKRPMRESSVGFLSSLATKAADAKMALVTGFQEIYNELVGPSST